MNSDSESLIYLSNVNKLFERLFHAFSIKISHSSNLKEIKIWNNSIQLLILVFL